MLAEWVASRSRPSECIHSWVDICYGIVLFPLVCCFFRCTLSLYWQCVYVHSVTAGQGKLNEARVTNRRTAYHHVTFLNIDCFNVYYYLTYNQCVTTLLNLHSVSIRFILSSGWKSSIAIAAWEPNRSSSSWWWLSFPLWPPLIKRGKGMLLADLFIPVPTRLLWEAF